MNPGLRVERQMDKRTDRWMVDSSDRQTLENRQLVRQTDGGGQVGQTDMKGRTVGRTDRWTKREREINK
jgi:hypothetical protein